jgi:hypothetical protein
MPEDSQKANESTVTSTASTKREKLEYVSIPLPNRSHKTVGLSLFRGDTVEDDGTFQSKVEIEAKKRKTIKHSNDIEKGRKKHISSKRKRKRSQCDNKATTIIEKNKPSKRRRREEREEETSSDDEESSQGSSTADDQEPNTKKLRAAIGHEVETAAQRSIVYPVFERHEHKGYKGFQLLATFSNIDSANSYARNYARMVTDQLPPKLQEKGYINKTTSTPDGRQSIRLTLAGHTSWKTNISVEEMKLLNHNALDAATPRSLSSSSG